MSYIHKNVNMYLLFLILFSATSLVGATVFFQQKMDNMAATYDSQVNQVHGMADELALKQAALQDAEKNLKLRQAREDKLSQINEKLASTTNEQQPTGAATIQPSMPKIQPSTIIGEGFTARPRRGMAAFIGSI